MHMAYAARQGGLCRMKLVSDARKVCLTTPVPLPLIPDLWEAIYIHLYFSAFAAVQPFRDSLFDGQSCSQNGRAHLLFGSP